MDDAGRKRHLEALFADEPFLSPTMKARRMHEKLYEMRALESEFGDCASATSITVDSPYNLSIREEPAFMRHGGLSEDGPRFTFAEAAELLRTHDESDRRGLALSEPIDHFRKHVLEQWVRKVDRRETDSRTEAEPGRETGHIMDETQR
jgi:hypothetical protein